MLTGNSGILTQTQNAKESTRGGDVQEQVNLAIAENEMAKYSGGEIKSRQKVIDDLEKAGKLTSDDVAVLQESNSVKIGNVTVDFSGLGSITGEKTLGEVYTDDMIGQEISYTANSSSGYTGKWIVFGKESSGKILITTELPIDNKFDLYGSAEKWLTYENDLDNVCSIYGGTVQGVSVTSRSITMKDINYVAGFTEPEFETFTFGSEMNYEGKKVNFKYPSLAAATDAKNPYWQDPTSVSATFKNNWYGYYDSWDSGEYLYWGADTNGSYVAATTKGIKTDKVKYIWGGNTEDTCYNDYLVASRSVKVNSGNARFNMAYVVNSEVNSDYYYLCYSDASGVIDRGALGSFGVRPVVSLPSDLLVEEQSSGIYDLKK